VVAYELCLIERVEGLGQREAERKSPLEPTEATASQSGRACPHSDGPVLDPRPRVMDQAGKVGSFAPGAARYPSSGRPMPGRCTSSWTSASRRSAGSTRQRAKATYTQPDRVRTYVMSATHNSFGLNALKCLLTRSAGHCSLGALRVVRGDLARPVAVQAHGPHQPLHGAAGVACPKPCAASGRFSIACIFLAPRTQ